MADLSNRNFKLLITLLYYGSNVYWAKFQPSHRFYASSALRAKITQKGPCDKNSRRQEQTYSQTTKGGFTDIGSIMGIVDTVTLRSGLNIPCVGLGTWQAKSEEVQAAVDTALDAGYRHFDTAFNYYNEEDVGKVLSNWLSSGKITREDLFITTKLPHIGNRASEVKKYLNKSLQRLQLDYVDLYLIHHPFGFVSDCTGEAPAVAENGNIALDMDTDHVAVWKALEQQVDAGKIKAIGVSNFNESQMARIMKNARIPLSVLQVELHANFQQKELRKFCKDHDIVVTAYSPLGSPGAKQHFQKKYNYSPTKFPDVLGNAVVCKLADKYKKTPAQILLRHLVQSNIVVIPKSVNRQRIQENFEIFDFQFSDEELCQLNDLDKGEEGRIFDFIFWKGVKDHPEYPFKNQ